MLKIIQPIVSGKRSFSLTAFIVAAVLILTGASADKAIPLTVIDGRKYISLNDFTKALDLENSFDHIYQKGRLYYKKHYMVYKSGYAVAVIDNSLFTSSYEVKRHRGGIYLPADMALAASEAFYPGFTSLLEDKRLILVQKKQEERKADHVQIYTTKGRIGFIIIDPGHGGRDPGAVGKGGVREKDITLQVSLKIEALLKKKYGNIKIMMTRRTDRFIELAQRAEIANREIKKDVNGLFISVHVNASISPKISGFETYYLSQNPTNEEARKTAALENNVIILENNAPADDVEYMEALMITTQIQKESSMLADFVQRGMDNKISEFRSRGVHRADFYVLRGALMPAVLAEIGFITHKKEAASLRKNSYQDKVAAGVCSGIIKFIDHYNKMIEQ